MKNIKDIISDCCIKVRIGNANNSSSSHSIAFAEDLPSESAPFGCEYGWGDFVLTSKKEKEKYMDGILFENLKRSIRINSVCLPSPDYTHYSNIDELINNYLFNTFIGDSLFSKDGYIDHQSVFYLPCDINGCLNLEFFEDFKKYICDTEGIIIVGGNDNSEKSERHYGENIDIPMQKDYNERYFSFKDKSTGQWILKNPKTGSVFIYSFGDKTVKKTEYPLLVDVNVSDKCKFGCKNCYRDCNENGGVVGERVLCEVLESLSSVGVADLVLGGGDVFELKNLPYFSLKKITSISTTINSKTSLSVLKERSYDINKLNSLAITLNGYLPQNVQDLSEKWECVSSKAKNVELVLQIIFEDFISKDPNLSLFSNKFIKDNVRKLSFVGYKEFGRAKKIDLNLGVTNQTFVNIADKYKGSIYFDSVMVERYGDMTKASYKYMVGREGVHSCFYDPIGGYLAKSSFSEERIPLVFNKDTFLNDFKLAWQQLS